MNRPDPNSADQSANNDDDAVWLDLVARLEATPSTGAGDSQEVAPAEPAPGEPARASFRDFDPLGLSSAAAAGDAPPAPGPRDYEVDDDEGFVPEEPPSLAGTEPLTMLAWLGAVGGPLALVFTAMFWRSAPLIAILGIVAAFIASVVYLIMKLPQEKNEDDDGARI
jgi:hypothetical protein